MQYSIGYKVKVILTGTQSHIGRDFLHTSEVFLHTIMDDFFISHPWFVCAIQFRGEISKK